jgi:SecD/SecF fusion protein
VITVLLVQIVCVALWVAGGPVLRDFAFAMVIGNIFGTYSSIGVAAPLVFEYQVRFAGKKVSSAGAGAAEPAPAVKVKDGGRRRK